MTDCLLSSSRTRHLEALLVLIQLVDSVITCHLQSPFLQCWKTLYMQLFILYLCWAPVLSSLRHGLKSLAPLPKM